MSEFANGEWERNGNVVFISEHHGWHKGEELLRNRITVSVQGYRETPYEEVEDAAILMQHAAALLQMLTRWQSKCAGFLEGRSDDNDLLLAETESLIAKAKGEAA